MAHLVAALSDVGRHRSPRGRALRLATAAAVLGPGLLAGLSDGDPAGITTYSVLGADHGYRLPWVLLLSTLALMLFHGLGARMGVVSGQRLIGLVRHRYGVRTATVTPTGLVGAAGPTPRRDADLERRTPGGVAGRQSRDRETMGELVVSPGIAVARVATLVMVCASVGLILVQSL